MSDDITLDTFLARVAAVNPFLENRVNGPAPAGQDVAVVHRAAFDRLTALAGETLGARRGLGAVLTGPAGIGKSHLLARLARWAGPDTAHLVYLHNLQAAPDALPRSLVNAVVAALTHGRRTGFTQTPLYQLALAGLVEAAGGQGHITWSRLEQCHQRWLDRLGPEAGDRIVHEVLYHFFRSANRLARSRGDDGVAGLAVRWLAGQALDPVEARLLGLPPGRRRDEPVALEDAQQLKQVIVALARLAVAHGKPFVLALDQVDNLEDEQFSALSRFLEALLDMAPGLLVVTAGIQPTLVRWRQEGVVQGSAWDRIGQFELRLQPLTPAQAQHLVGARLDDFLTPFATLAPVEERRRNDPLFPLGRAWSEQHLLRSAEIRPRQVISLAREGWRQEQAALDRLGGDWLAGWPHQAGEPVDDGPHLTREQEEALIDQEVERELEVVRRRLLSDPGELPPDGDRLASVLFDLLEACRSRQAAPDLVSVRRLPPPRPGASPTYHLHLQTRAAGGEQTTGVLVLTARHATSAAGFLRRLLEDARPLDRIVLLTDERVPLALGERGRDYLAQLEALPAPELVKLELSFAEVVELEALHAVAGRAGRGRCRPTR